MSVRLMLIKSLNPNGVAPSITDILLTAKTWSLRNRLKMTEYKCLFDKTYNLIEMVDGDTPFKLFHIYKRLNDVVVCNDGNAGTIADVERTAYFWVILGSKADGADEGTCDYQTQVKFTDS